MVVVGYGPTIQKKVTEDVNGVSIFRYSLEFRNEGKLGKLRWTPEAMKMAFGKHDLASDEAIRAIIKVIKI